MNRKIIVLNDKILDLTVPLTMSIVNITPDSFYVRSRVQNEKELLHHIEISLQQNAGIIDIGGCSTRPGAQLANEQSEWQRLNWALTLIRKHFGDIAISVDTFRPEIAHKCIEQYRVALINDVSGGCDAMYDVLVQRQVPYVLTFSDDITSVETADLAIVRMLQFFAQKIAKLRQKGFNKEIVIDPGFGFGKTLEQNYWILENLSVLNCFNAPILVGISRKSMICQKQNCTPEQALQATREVERIAIKNGANIIRTHLV